MNLSRHLVISLMVLLSPTLTYASLIDFEDLVTYMPGTSHALELCGPIEDGYHGFNWRGENYQKFHYGVKEGFLWMDGIDYAYGHGTELNMIRPGGYFDFTGIEIGSYFFNYQELVVQGWKDYDLLYENTVVLPSAFSIESFVVNYSGRDKLTIFATDSGVLTDPLAPTIHQLCFNDIDFEFASDSSTPVPEPATMLLFGTGCLVLCGSRWRRKKHLN